jgi:hypothetical protein
MDTPGGDPVTDADTAQAIEALAHRIRQRDISPDRADAEVFALEFMTALRARGWRATEARAIPAWKPSVRGSKPVLSEETEALKREAHADAEARAERFRAAHRGDSEPQDAA